MTCLQDTIHLSDIKSLEDEFIIFNLLRFVAIKFINQKKNEDKKLRIKKYKQS